MYKILYEDLPMISNTMRIKFIWVPNLVKQTTGQIFKHGALKVLKPKPRFTHNQKWININKEKPTKKKARKEIFFNSEFLDSPKAQKLRVFLIIDIHLFYLAIKKAINNPNF